MTKFEYAEYPSKEELEEKYKDVVQIHEYSEEELEARRESIAIANEMRKKQKVKDAERHYIK